MILHTKYRSIGHKMVKEKQCLFFIFPILVQAYVYRVTSGAGAIMTMFIDGTG